MSTPKSNTTNCNRNNSHLLNPTPAESARIMAGLSLEQAAKKLNLTPRYLQQIERSGNASIKTARRLARLYRCSGNIFIFPPKYFTNLGQRTIQASSASPTAGADTGVSARAGRRSQSPQVPTLSLVPKAEKGTE